MKNQILKTVAMVLCFGIASIYSFAQKKSIAVIQLDAVGILLNASQLGDLARLELEKTQVHDVLGKYDLVDMLGKDTQFYSNCFSKSCLMEAGKKLKMDKMLGGSVERFGEKLIISLRIIDVTTGEVEKLEVDEYVNVEPEIQTMIRISLNKLFALPNEEIMVERLTKKFNYESATINPGRSRLASNGPRMGVALVTGDAAKRLKAPRSQGGYDMYPFMTQFGYQFEIQYLNEGSFQALVEFIPLVSGIDQGMFIPTLTFLNGFRNNESGWEIAFGPYMGFARRAQGYYKGDVWHLKSEWKDTTDTNPNEIVERLDRRGDPAFISGFVIAFGKTFKSGRVNMPVNFYVIPKKDGWQIGASFGFNARKNYQ